MNSCDMTTNKPTAPLPPVPGAHVDDDSVAGEEDPGASLEELPRPTLPEPVPAKAPPAPDAKP
jgi:hypothetical protein